MPVKKITDKVKTHPSRWGRLPEAKSCGFSRSSLYRLRDEGKIVVSKINGALFWDLHSIDRLLEESIQQPQANNP
jgi:predicted DNA-binding transcriptional regulator AlpA|tara:strand:+ start:884 stop:1108 length:225 start_codon:yes stop_codon:yes gene_type:complete